MNKVVKCTEKRDCPYKTTMPENPKDVGNCNYDKVCEHQSSEGQKGE